MRIAGALITLLAAAPAAGQQPGSNLQVYLLTMGPGAEIYERFGHNAIWIRDAVAHTDRIYNYGMFSFGRGTTADLLSFAFRFAMGPQQYWLGVDSSLDNELQLYRARGRDLSAQELNLLPPQRADLALRLAVNAREENKYYAYDYFRDNCSTRVRDILDSELGGALKQATLGKPAAGTLRFHTQRSITNDKLMLIGIDAAFGPRVDRPLDQWDEMFLPEKVAKHIGELTVAGPDGQPVPLVGKEFSLLTIGAYHVEPKPPAWAGVFLVFGLVVAGLIRLSDSRRATAFIGRAVGGAWLLLMGTGGLVLLFFWTFTQHAATWQNHNLLLLSPLALALVPSFWYRTGKAPPRWPPIIATVTMASVAIGAALALLPGIGGQQNQLIAALTAVPTFVGALEARRRWNWRMAKPNAPRP